MDTMRLWSVGQRVSFQSRRSTLPRKATSDLAQQRTRFRHPSATQSWSFSSTAQQNSEDGDNDESVLLQAYRTKIRQQNLEMDPHQIHALTSLERLRRELETYQPPPIPDQPALHAPSSAGGMSDFLGGLFGTHSVASAGSLVPDLLSTSPPKGVYCHGGVGCGKTFLMHLFFESLEDLPAWRDERRLIHFHQFMLQIHRAMHEARTASSHHDPDTLLPRAIHQVASQGYRVICLDEFQVTDVADALVLQRLFHGLWHDYGCILVATSNRPPQELYLNGLQRDRFLPFIADLEKQCEVVSLWEATRDYRLWQRVEDEETPSVDSDTDGSLETASTTTTTATTKPSVKAVSNALFFSGKEGRKECQKFLRDTLVGSSTAFNPTILNVPNTGRSLRIPQASLSRGVCRFSFEDVCQKALGAADYWFIAQYFHTIVVDQIPTLRILEHLNWTRRFITFIDALYENNVKLILHAKKATSVEGILEIPEEMRASKEEDDTESETTTSNHNKKGASKGAHDEVFAWERTLSRIREMTGNQSYLQRPWLGGSFASTRKTKSDEKPTPHPMDMAELSKAALVSRRQAVVSVVPSIGDDKARK